MEKIKNIILVSSRNQKDKATLSFKDLKLYEDNHSEHSLIWDLLLIFNDSPEIVNNTITIPLDLNNMHEIVYYFKNEGWPPNTTIKYLPQKKSNYETASKYLNVFPNIVAKKQKNKKVVIESKENFNKKWDKNNWAEEYEWPSEDEEKQFKREYQEAKKEGDVYIDKSENESDYESDYE